MEPVNGTAQHWLEALGMEIGPELETEALVGGDVGDGSVFAVPANERHW
jgi:hypothetical protein